ncbi:type VI secretion system-associated FHA domain protein TagH [Porphyrobacter sp. AAP60]|uniref:type VI secretion system-associated FHA domain protein TagH n=1 Tax=Porphyrobacter sp. AAP60 TaxID=1523423 RepID=UPI0006B8946C|nr:type VI secretion system-associated FHA domain protein TagH [Porphyrobacter sp. AAP60]
MTLTLKIINGAGIEHGANTELVLNNRGANLGRSLTCEWVLPDEARSVSSKHCEIQFRDNSYYLIDYGSTNGTFVGASDQRLDGAHRVAPGDRIRIGPYLIEARLSGTALQQHQAEQEQAAASARGPSWQAWDDVPGGRPSAPAPAPAASGFPEDGGWDIPGGGGTAPDRNSVWSEDLARASNTPSADDIFSDFTAKNEIDWTNASWSVDPAFDPFAVDGGEPSGFAPLPGGTPPAAPAPPPASSGGFDPLPGAAAPAPPSGGGFAPLSDDPFAPAPGPIPAPVQSPPPPPTPPPSGGSFAPLDPGAPQAPFPSSPPPADPWPDPVDQPTVGPWGPGAEAPASSPAHAPAPAPATPPIHVRPSPVPHAAAADNDATMPVPQPPPPARPDAVFGALLGELGVPASQIKLSPEESAAKTGRMLRHLLAGLMILLEARARAKDEMGAAGTALGFDGNNPLKFARNVDQALQMMMNPKLRGYMEAEDAIEEAYRDLQAHQIATLKAMQGALRETLNRFSPAAIKARTKEQGLLSKVLPGQREAALWKAYEAQFSGVAEGSAEAFLEVFSREFRQAYEEANQRPRR